MALADQITEDDCAVHGGRRQLVRLPVWPANFFIGFLCDGPARKTRGPLYAFD
jgi:hypothetical protein